MSIEEINLKVEVIPQQHVGTGRAIIDPKILEDTNWSTGQILELTFNKKTHVNEINSSLNPFGSILSKGLNVLG